MRTRTKRPILDSEWYKEVDPQLREQYNNKKNYNPIKRLIIERKYQKALDKIIEEKYKNASIKVD